ncbi:SlyX family protein [Gallaecimonas sp. GXIMD4217]|uniref:SlyX family protein n=1 Tax=Gallaecimonas sp. GXIMD4217 TaxID=3131927 RepID=UPI00311AE727
MTDINERLEYLETKVAYQDATIHDLSDQIAALQQLVEKQRQQMAYLAQKMKEVQVSHVAGEHEETPPPHY